jgi:hypothetical protein
MRDHHTFKLTTLGKRTLGTRKNTVQVIVTDKPVSLYGGYWDGGSRNEWWAVSKNGTRSHLSYPTAPPQFGGGKEPDVTPTDDMTIAQGGCFCGKDRQLWFYATRLDWFKPEWGTEVIK